MFHKRFNSKNTGLIKTGQINDNLSLFNTLSQCVILKRLKMTLSASDCKILPSLIANKVKMFKIQLKTIFQYR